MLVNEKMLNLHPFSVINSFTIPLNVVSSVSLPLTADNLHLLQETTSLLMKELDELKPSTAAASTGIKAHPRSRNSTTTGSSLTAQGSWDSESHRPAAATDRHPSEPHNVARAIIQAVKSRRASSKSASAPKSQGSTPKKTSLFGGLSRGRKGGSTEFAEFTEAEPVGRSNGHAGESPRVSELGKSRLSRRLQLDLQAPGHSHLSERQQRLHRYSREYQRAASIEQSSSSGATSHNGGFHVPQQSQDFCGETVNDGRRTTTATVIHHQSEAVEQRGPEHNLIAYNSALLQVRPGGSTSPVEEEASSSRASSATPHLSTFAKAPTPPTMDAAGPSGVTPTQARQSPRLRVGGGSGVPRAIPESSVEPPPVNGRRSWTSSTTGEEEGLLLGGMRESKAASVGLPIDTIDSATSGDEEAVLSGGDESVVSATTGRRPRPTTVQLAGPSTSRAAVSSVIRREAPPGVALPSCAVSVSPVTETFLEFRGRFATSYRLEGAGLRSPVDACLLPNDCLAVADYDNGFLLLSPDGQLLRHQCPLPENKNACGIVCSIADGEFRLLVLVYKEGVWSINIYNWCFDLVEVLQCPQEPGIESWALRKIVLGEVVGSGTFPPPPGSSDSGPPTPTAPVPALFLMATGEAKTVIWAKELGSDADWEMMISEAGRRGPYNDFDVRFDARAAELHFLLVDWKKAQLSTVQLNSALQLVDTHTVRIRRVKGQEWVVQGPKLASWDEARDVLVYDGSGKLFLFDGDTFKCRKIVADLGKGEVSALCVRDGWVYVLCRYRLSLEVFRYKDLTETTL